MKILVADKLSQAGLDWLEAQGDVELTVETGLSPRRLGEIVGGFDGMIIRSGVKVTDETLRRPGRLKVIARAGVGVDNVDVELATKMGIVVMNTPDGNTLSTAELSIALMLALSRCLASANQSLRSGKWDRKAYQGTQLADKTLGVIGMGRIGQAVARRAVALKMRVVGFDPFFAGEVAPGIEMTGSPEELYRRSDYITVHVPASSETLGMIGAEQLAMMKPTVRLVNAARGGIIDEKALLDALDTGKIAGAALDVYTSEPPESDVQKKLIAHPNVLAVPHLGASTVEAQEQVALQAAGQMVEFLRGGEVRNALNAPGFAEALPPLVRAYGELAQRMAILLASIASGGLKKIEIVYRGSIAKMNLTPITTSALVGLLANHVDQPVNVINAPLIASERGLEVSQVTVDSLREFKHLVEIRLSTSEGTRWAAGTLLNESFGRIVSVDGFRMELKPDGHVLFIFNDDMPGVVGCLGTILGESGINIADMMISRKKTTQKAMMGLSLDSRPDESVLDRIRDLQFVNDALCLYFPPLSEGGDEEGTSESFDVPEGS